jgi:YHS domain-containing protein
MLARRHALRAATAALLFAAGEPVLVPNTAHAEVPRLALKGYDPVAYFTEGRPMPGKEEFEYTWDEVRYRFASDQHLSMFRGDPDRYVSRSRGRRFG